MKLGGLAATSLFAEGNLVILCPILVRYLQTETVLFRYLQIGAALDLGWVRSDLLLPVGAALLLAGSLVAGMAA
jgi:hypothetical protein